MKKYVFGIDVGGTTIKCGLFSSKGEMLDSWEIVTNKTDNGDHIISDIAATIQSKCEEKGINMDEVEGVGVGVPGPVDNNGLVKVVEKGTARKDRYSSIAYGNYLAGLIEKEEFKKKKRGDSKMKPLW